MKKIAVMIVFIICLFSLTGCNIKIPFIGSLNKADQVNSQETPETSGAEPDEASDTTSGAVGRDTDVVQTSINIPGVSYQKELKLTGKSAPGNSIIINEKVFHADHNGDYSAEVSLVPGKNPIDFRVVSQDGKSIYNKGYTVEYYVKPKLEITQFDKTSNSLINIVGNTDPDCLVSIKGYIIQSDNKGIFKLTVPVDDWESSVTILATNTAGYSTSLQRRFQTGVD